MIPHINPFTTVGRNETDSTVIIKTPTNDYLTAALAADPHIVKRGIDRWNTPHSAYEHRDKLVKKYAWAIPNDIALNAIVNLGCVVEIGAGTGYWAYHIAARGADVVAYDVQPSRNDWCDVDVPYFPIKIGDHQALEVHQDRALFLCWPPMSNMAENCLFTYRGSTVVFVGENEGGCCANDHFFTLLNTQFDLTTEIVIPQWQGMHDCLQIYTRK